ncbi:MAG: hypothetical protein KatS3mg031_2863 [Chitinophagales bacterium]|nr:MAG: hypothetical protein KatS3mg031_2863 [Chitinophagales bacterium]
MDRKPIFSPSGVHKLLGKGKKEYFSQEGISYIYEVVYRRLGGEIPDINTFSVNWGKEQEQEAKKVLRGLGYEFVDGEFKASVEFPDWVGGTCDGLGEDFILEIKCPSTYLVHMKSVLDGEINKAYIAQMQAYMWLYDKPRALFVSFDPRLPHAAGLHVIEVPREEDSIEFMKEQLGHAIEYAEELLTRLENVKLPTL